MLLGLRGSEGRTGVECWQAGRQAGRQAGLVIWVFGLSFLSWGVFMDGWSETLAVTASID